MQVQIELRGTDRRGAVELAPARRWEVFIVPHTHLDIGFTDLQERVWEALAKNLDDDLVLKRCKLHPEAVEKPKSKGKKRTKREPAPKPKRFILDISGFGRSQKAISQFVLRLEGSKLFEKVTAVKTNREPFMAGKAMAFQIRCLLGRKQEAQ